MQPATTIHMFHIFDLITQYLYINPSINRNKSNKGFDIVYAHSPTSISSL